MTAEQSSTTIQVIHVQDDSKVETKTEKVYSYEEAVDLAGKVTSIVSMLWTIPD